MPPKTKSILLLLRNVLLPLCRSHSHNRLKGNTECVVITEATLVGQLLGGNRLMGCDCLTIEVNEVLDTQTVDVCIVSVTSCPYLPLLNKKW